MTVDQEVAVLRGMEKELLAGIDDQAMPKPLLRTPPMRTPLLQTRQLQTLGQRSTTSGLAEAAAREFDRKAYEGGPASPDPKCMRACVDDLAQRDG